MGESEKTENVVQRNVATDQFNAAPVKLARQNREYSDTIFVVVRS